MEIDKNKYYKVISQKDYDNLLIKLYERGENIFNGRLTFDDHWRYVIYDEDMKLWRLGYDTEIINKMKNNSYDDILTEFPEIEELLNESKKITNT